MKTILTTAVVLVTLSFSTQTQVLAQNSDKATKTDNSYEVGSRIIQKFKADFDNTQITGTKKNGLINEVQFMQNNENKTAFYDEAGSLIGITTGVKFSSLPQRAQDIINKKFADYTKGPVILFDDNEANDYAMILYQQSFSGEDSYFIELKKGNEEIILQASMDGEVVVFKR
jgi:uncharacterized protein YxeA